MDLNYLFYRQQIELSMAEAAGSEVVRMVHEQLAVQYEREIRKASEAGTPAGEPNPLFQWVPSSAFVEEGTVNPTMAVAMTARQVR